MELTVNSNLKTGSSLLCSNVPETYVEGRVWGQQSAATPAFHAAVAIVIAYLKNATCSHEQVMALLHDAHREALNAIRCEENGAKPVAAGHREVSGKKEGLNAISAEASVSDDYIICLEDGKKVKSLRFYLRRYGMTAEQYKLKWNLPDNYPLVAPSLSRKRSDVAKQKKIHLFRKISSSNSIDK